MAAAPAAFAQTPDWMTPAVETICDNESGAAFGLCNAYCEAMDCELANDGDPQTEPAASQNACDKVRGKYQHYTGKDLPCEVSCPCNDPEVNQIWVDITNGDIPLDFCFDGPISGFVDIRLVTTFGEPIAIAGELGTGFLICATPDGDAGPLTPAQDDLCRQELEDAAALWSVACVPAP